MSALDEAVSLAEDHPSGPDCSDALAELALLRRCRDAVVGLAAQGHHDCDRQWWRGVRPGSGEDMCIICFDTEEPNDGDLEWHVPHAADCPALAIDVLAKEVRDA